MVEYTTASRDLEMGLEQRTLVLVEKKSSTGRMWKTTLALLSVALCFGGILLFAWYWNGKSDKPHSGQTQALTEEKATTEPHYNLTRISSKAQAAIHLEGNYEEGENPKDQLEWRNGQGQAFVQGGFQLVNNSIIIPKTGLYFVYSQASFRVSCTDLNRDMAENGLLPLSHRIWRYSDSIGSRASLMSAVRSACQKSVHEASSKVGQGWYNTIYLGAVFKLNTGDKLWTETNQLSELETDEGKTFFGVFAL